MEYQRTFGGIADLRAAHAASAGAVPEVDHLGHAVLGFFDYGGRVAVVRRLSTPGVSPVPLLDPEAFAGVLAGLEVDGSPAEASVVVTPGLALDARGRPVIDAVIRHCESTRSCVAVVDAPCDTDLARPGAAGALGLPASSFAALYHPWLIVRNHVHDPLTAPDAPATLVVPPSGFVAGLWARTDRDRGVWTAPAGVEAVLLGVEDLRFATPDRSHSSLARAGANAIRRIPCGPPVAWGARTLGGHAAAEWKYLNVRRLGVFLERSTDLGIQWAVFEPNEDRLWAALRGLVEGFLTGLWRAGAFTGSRPQEAFAVRCGLGETMTQTDLDDGTLVLEVLFAPLRPAEFVILRFRVQTASAP